MSLGVWELKGALCFGTQLPWEAQSCAGEQPKWGPTTSGARRVEVQPPKKWALLGGGQQSWVQMHFAWGLPTIPRPLPMLLFVLCLS